jgi:uncharacterized protein
MYKAGQKKSMPLNILEIVFKRINEYLIEYPKEMVEVIWHGGEPLLLGADYFQKAVELQRLHCADTTTRIRHSIQTNLTCFDQSFAEPLRELGINSIGTSFDPEPHMRGPGKDVDSDYYNQMFIRGLTELERSGFGWGFIYVVTKKSLQDPLAVFHFMTNLELSGGVNFNPVLIYDSERRDIAVTPQDYVEFLGKIFPVWWQNRHRYPNVSPFKSLVESIIDGHTSLGCCDSGTCTYHQVNIAPDGATSQCGRSADWGLLNYGSIEEKQLKEILADPQRDELHHRVEHLPEADCKGCRFWDICHGGCPLDAYSKHKSFKFKSEWCEAKRGFIKDHFEPVTGVKYEPKRKTNR